MSVTASSNVSGKYNMILYSIKALKEDLRRLKTFFPLADRHSRLTAAAFLKAAFNNGGRTNKIHQNIRRKRNEKGGRRGGEEKRKKKTAGFSRGSQSVEGLMQFLEEVPRPLERKTQNHSVLGRDREEDSRLKKNEMQTVKHKKGTKIKKVGPELFGLKLQQNISERFVSSVLNQNT